MLLVVKKIFSHFNQFYWVFGFGVLLLVLLFCLGLFFTPSPSHIRSLALGSDRVLLARDGSVLQTLRTDFKKRRLVWFPLKNFTVDLQQAVIFTEDQRFRSHWGFDLWGLVRALKADLSGHPIQGASTITMQLGDLIQEDVLLEHRRIHKRSIVHKVLQLGRAILLEIRWSKEEILEAYLNLIHLKGEFQGVPALSFAYFHKHPLVLEQAQAWLVAAMISAPNQRASSLFERACLNMKRKMSLDEVSCDALKVAAKDLDDPHPAIPSSPGNALHLARRLFKENPKGSFLSSNVDAQLQQAVSAVLEKNIFRLQNSHVNDSAGIVIENATGKVLAYVGAVSTSESEHVDGVLGYRQAGSSLKPFLYAKAIETKTLTAASILRDDPTAISWGGEVYRPTNYDRHFNGAVSVREALASSLNVPAVKVVSIIGLHQAYQVLQSLKFSRLREPDFYGVSMALGAVEVRLDELANAYRVLANRGNWSALHFLATDEVKDSSVTKIFSPQATFIVSQILSDPNARSMGFGWETPLETSFWTAVKTGTSKDYRDNWCLGFSDRYTVGVWVGNFDAKAMDKVSGISGAGPSWYEIMNFLHARDLSQAPLAPEKVVSKKVRHPWSSQAHIEYFIAGSEPAQENIEPAPHQRLQFIFPAENSLLVKDPHLDQRHIALWVRFSGSVPEKADLFWNEKKLGPAVSPFKVESPPLGLHHLSLRGADGKTLVKVSFEIKGGS